jgi:hypothetical protein
VQNIPRVRDSQPETGEQSATGIDDVIDVEVDMFGRHPVRISAELWTDLLRDYNSRIEANRTILEASQKRFISTGAGRRNLALLGFQASPARASDKGS